MPFDGFISYSHAADGQLAPAVQRGLHRLAKPWHRRRALWIFRDQTGLAVTPALWTSIQDALDGSKHFVLLASPEAASSPWVNREIEHWVATKSPDLILPVVTDGEWQWDPDAGDFTAESTAVPAALRGVFAEEPLYLDLRWARTDVHLSLQHARFRDAIAQLAAPMHGISKDELEGEDVRNHRRARRLSAFAAAALVLLTLVASLASVVATRNVDRANAAAVRAQLQEKVATEQRGTAERATEESQRQQENARVQEVRAEDAKAETQRQATLAREQQALAEDAAAEAKREQAAAQRYQASADRQKANAERQKANADRQQAAAKGASEEATRQKAEAKRQKENAERQLANARQQQRLADEATARAQEQEKLAKKFSEQAQKADQERQKQEKLARAAAEEARRFREETELQRRVAVNRRLMNRARAMVTDDPRKALRLGVAAQQLHSDEETRDQLSHLVMATNYAGGFADSLEVASVGGQAVASAGAGGTVSLWNTADPAKPVRLGPLPAAGTTDKKLAAGPDGRTLAVFDGGAEVALWDVTDPARPVRKATLTDAAGIDAVTFGWDGHTVATSNHERNTILWNVGGAAAVALATLPAYRLAISPDGKAAVATGDVTYVWDLTDPAHPVRGAEFAPEWSDPPKVNAAVEWNPALPVVALEEPLGGVTLWDMTDLAQPEPGWGANFDSGLPTFSSMAFSPDGTMLALGDADGATTVWAVELYGGLAWLPTLFSTLNTRGGPVRSMAFSRDGRTLATAGYGRTATIWYPRGRFNRDPVSWLPGPYPARIIALEFGSENRLYAGLRDGTAVPWSVAKPAAPVRGEALPLLSGRANGFTLSSDGSTMAVVGADEKVTLFDTSRPGAPVPLSSFKEEGGGVIYTFSFNQKGTMLAVGRGDGRLSLWDLKNLKDPKLIKALPVRAELSTLGFSPDGKTLAIGEGHNISLWNITDPTDPQRLTSIYLKQWFTLYDAENFAFSPDGRMLAAATSLDKTAMLWDVSDPAQPYKIATLTGHEATINYMAFTPDSGTLVTTDGNNVVRAWDITEPATPIKYVTFKSPEMQSSAAALSRDGRMVATGGKLGAPNQTLSLWDITVPEDLAADPVRYACAAGGRGLNAEEWARYIPELDYRATC
jgi:WD40 repeat protein